MPIEKKTKNYVDRQLRRIFRWTKAYKECQERCLIEPNLYQCEGCHELISKNGKYKGKKECRSSKLYVDHIEPYVPLSGWESADQWAEEAIKRMFLDAGELQYLCHQCHAKKTKEENGARKRSNF